MSHRLPFLLLLLAGVAFHAPDPTYAQDKEKPAQEKKDGDKDKDKDKGTKKKDGGTKDGDKKKDAEKKPKKKTAEQIALEAVGAELKKAKAAALVARMKKDGKLTVEFKGKTGKKGPFKKDQAKKVLEAWFKKHTIVKLKLDRVSGAVGTFKMTTRPKGRDKQVKTTLRITLLKDGKRFYLHKIQET